MQDGEVEDDQRQLEGHAEAQLELDDDVHVAGHARRDGAQAHGLVGEPLERRVQDDAVAEDGAHDEQHHCRDERGDEPLALVGLERRQEKRQQLPQDNRRASHDGRPDGDLEAGGERLERVDGHERRQAVGALRQVLGNGDHQELAHGGRGEVEHAHADEQAHDDAHQAHAQLAQMIE